MGRYGPFLECGDLKASAFAHISNANKKDPTDLSMPSQPTPSELLQLQQKQQYQGREHQLDSSSTGAAAVTSPEIMEVDGLNDTVAFSAEDVIAFGLGATSNSSGDNGDASVDCNGSGGGSGGTWYSAVSLERAVGLLSLPRVVCEEHPTDGGPIEVGVGRFGVWVKHKDSYKNVPGGVDVLDVDEALAVQLTDEMIQVSSFWRRSNRVRQEVAAAGVGNYCMMFRFRIAGCLVEECNHACQYVRQVLCDNHQLKQ